MDVKTVLIVFAIIVFVLILLGGTIALLVAEFILRKDCDCAAEGENCLITSKSYSIKYVDTKDPTKYTEKKFGLGGDYVVTPLTVKCEQASFATDPSPGNAKKCTLTKSQLSFC